MEKFQTSSILGFGGPMVDSHGSLKKKKETEEDKLGTSKYIENFFIGKPLNKEIFTIIFSGSFCFPYNFHSGHINTVVPLFPFIFCGYYYDIYKLIIMM